MPNNCCDINDNIISVDLNYNTIAWLQTNTSLGHKGYKQKRLTLKTVQPNSFSETRDPFKSSAISVHPYPSYVLLKCFFSVLRLLFLYFPQFDGHFLMMKFCQNLRPVSLRSKMATATRLPIIHWENGTWLVIHLMETVSFSCWFLRHVKTWFLTLRSHLVPQSLT